jgi:hypothetical protein
MNATRPVRLRSEHALSTAEGASSSAGTESNSREGTKPQREDRIQGLPPPARCLLPVFSLLGGFDRGYVSRKRAQNESGAVAFAETPPSEKEGLMPFICRHLLLRLRFWLYSPLLMIHNWLWIGWPASASRGTQGDLAKAEKPRLRESVIDARALP